MDLGGAGGGQAPLRLGAEYSQSTLSAIVVSSPLNWPVC